MQAGETHSKVMILPADAQKDVEQMGSRGSPDGISTGASHTSRQPRVERQGISALSDDETLRCIVARSKRDSADSGKSSRLRLCPRRWVPSLIPGVGSIPQAWSSDRVRRMEGAKTRGASGRASKGPATWK